METERTEEEIEAVLAKIADGQGVSRWPGMTYEVGIRAALEWLFEDGPDPMED